MDSNDMEQLLERYWRCETTVEEEARLRDFFTREDVPAHLRRYRALFAYQQPGEDEHLDEAFDARLLKAVGEAQVVKARKLAWGYRLAPFFRAAAVVALVFGLGILAQRSFYSEEEEMAVAASDTIGRQMNAPSVALTKEASAVGGQQKIDTLQQK